MNSTRMHASVVVKFQLSPGLKYDFSPCYSSFMLLQRAHQLPITAHFSNTSDDSLHKSQLHEGFILLLLRADALDCSTSPLSVSTRDSIKTFFLSDIILFNLLHQLH